MFSKAFAADAAERAIRAFAWSLLGLLGADATVIPGVVEWKQKLTAAAFAGLLSLLTSVASSAVNPASASDSGSLLPASVDPPQGDPGHGTADLLVTICTVVVALAAVVWLADRL